MTPFALLCDRCGLSTREAADFLTVRHDTVKSWSSGRNPAPGPVLDELRALYVRIDRAARETVMQIDAMPAPAQDVVELGIAADDHEARSLGWPCVGAQAAVLGLVVAATALRVRIVPRGAIHGR